MVIIVGLAVWLSNLAFAHKYNPSFAKHHNVVNVSARDIDYIFPPAADERNDNVSIVPSFLRGQEAARAHSCTSRLAR